MATILKIKFEGDVPGIAEHRLSISAFGMAIRHLRIAVQRIAMTSDIDEHDPISNSGRIPFAVRNLDLQIAAIGEGSVIPEFAVCAKPPTGSLIPIDLLEQKITLRLLEELEKAGAGKPTSKAISKFLSSLPSAITSQDYQVWTDGKLIKETSLGKPPLPVERPILPRLAELTGWITGIRFEEGKEKITFKGASGEFSATATSEQVELALNNRTTQVRATVVQKEGKYRLVRIVPSKVIKRNLNEDEYEERVWKRWDGVLQELAK